MRLKFGMIGGAGGGVSSKHFRAVTMDHLCELKAGCFSRNLERNKQQAEFWGLEDESRVYPDYRTMAEVEAARTEDDRLDFVIIVTPNDSHYEIAKLFMEKGFHIVCDKPIAVTVEQAEKLAALAKEKDLMFALTYTYSAYPMIRQARELIDHGEIGDIVYINAEYPQEWLSVAFAQPNSDPTNALWRLDPSVVGNSQATADIGTHLEHLIKAATGLSPKRVLAKFDKVPETLALESSTTILCEYPNNITGLIWASQVAIGHECDLRLRVFGTKGSIEWQHQDAGHLKVSHLCKPVQIYSSACDYNYVESTRLTRTDPGHPEGLHEAFGNIYRSFAEVLLARKEGRTPDSFTYPTADDGVIGVRFVNACVESNRLGNIWVDV